MNYNLIPTTVQEWRADGEDKIYNREMSYDDINGGVEKMTQSVPFDEIRTVAQALPRSDT